MSDLIKNEVNVKELQIVDSDNGILVKRVKPDFKKLGPKFGKMMKQAAAAIQGLSQAQIAQLERDGAISLDIDGNSINIEAADVEIISEDIPGWLVANEGNVTVALDVTVTPELRREGIARDLINRIQNIRKSRDYQITDRILIKIENNEFTNDAVNAFKDYIASQVLADDIQICGVEAPKDDEILDIDDVKVIINIEKSNI